MFRRMHASSFTSDWEDQLGKTPNGDNYQTDVFVVELK